MRRRSLVILILVIALGLFMPTLLAGQGKGKEKSKGKGKPQAAARYERTADGWERHDRYDMRIYRPQEGRPPGWEKGNKVGWRDCGLPPGQAKKYGGCRAYVYEGRRYYYYQDEIGRIIVRRPRIDIQAVIH